MHTSTHRRRLAPLVRAYMHAGTYQSHVDVVPGQSLAIPHRERIGVTTWHGHLLRNDGSAIIAVTSPLLHRSRRLTIRCSHIILHRLVEIQQVSTSQSVVCGNESQVVCHRFRL
jgi:hypothetical protein